MFQHGGKYDLIVVGAGHAGCEAALAAARMGCRVLLLTGNLDTTAQMSCNPAIGGLAKGHIVREIDALGGEMARNIDETAIQFRVLNKKKGPAVWANRAQADKRLYQQRMKSVLEAQEGLYLKQEMVTGLLLKGRKARGVECATNNRFLSETVIVTSGTFLNGVIHIGLQSFPSGRAGEAPSIELARNLSQIGFQMGRLKTGTPARINARSIRFDRFVRQDGDKNPLPFSFRTSRVTAKQLPCYIGYTNEKTRKEIVENLDRSPLFSGKIKGTGVRYCPSIEDKFVKFPEKAAHQVFLEPEGRHTSEIYLNGLSTSLPYDVQLKLIRSIDGLEDAEIMRPGYSVEYDFAAPTQLYPTLETKVIRGLYFAGQINGTSGYEEAAAQGLMAGINAVLKLNGAEPIVLDRSEAYIGVLIDDIVTKGTAEPYRMFTSRAEYRLLLRQDNADIRLMHYGNRLGLIPDAMMRKVDEKKRLIEDALLLIRQRRFRGITIEKWLRRPGFRYGELRASMVPDLPEYADGIVEQVEIAARYAGYISRQKEEIKRFRRMEVKKIPPWLDYSLLTGLKKEAREKLKRIRPLSIGQAARISGITPADISVLMICMEKELKGD